MTRYFICCFCLLVHGDVTRIVFLGKLPAFLCFIKITFLLLKLNFKATFLTYFPQESGILELKWAIIFQHVMQTKPFFLFLLNIHSQIYILKAHSFKKVYSVNIMWRSIVYEYCSLSSLPHSFLFHPEQSLTLGTVCRLDIIFFFLSQFTFLREGNHWEMYPMVIQYFIYTCLIYIKFTKKRFALLYNLDVLGNQDVLMTTKF